MKRHKDLILNPDIGDEIDRKLKELSDLHHRSYSDEQRAQHREMLSDAYSSREFFEGEGVGEVEVNLHSTRTAAEEAPDSDRDFKPGEFEIHPPENYGFSYG